MILDLSPAEVNLILKSGDYISIEVVITGDLTAKDGFFFCPIYDKDNTLIASFTATFDGYVSPDSTITLSLSEENSALLTAGTSYTWKFGWDDATEDRTTIYAGSVTVK